MRNKRVPEIRFPGFTDDWEQRKLSDEVEVIGTGKSKFKTSTGKSDETPYAVLGSTDVIGYDSHFDYSGDFILTARVGANAGTLYTHSGNVKISDNTVFIKSYNLNFIYYMLTKFDLRKLSFGTGQPLVKASELKSVKLMFPKNKHEQTQIGKFFNQLDNTITLHQRELETLKQTKQGFLQKMFPKKGESVPEIRFPGFTDDWEQRRLGDIGDFIRISVNPQVTPNDEFIEYSMPSFDNGRLPDRVFGYTMQSNRLKIFGNVLLINKLNVRQKRIWLVNNAPENAVASSEFMPYTSEEIELGFLEQLMLSDKTTRHLETLSSGTSNSQKRITPSDYLRYKILAPKNKKEQSQIAAFFKALDNLITLHQRELETLNQTKKAFLQKMFI